MYMKKNTFLITKFIIFLIFVSYSAFSQVLTRNNYCDIRKYTDDSISNNQNYDKSVNKYLYLRSATGNLTISGMAQKFPYIAYFIIPISLREQAPLWLDIDCPQMIDYRYVQLSTHNIVLAAKLNNYSGTTYFKWTSYVLIKQHNYNGIPTTVPIPLLTELPDSVKPWLMPTGCVQWEDSTIKHIADSLRGTTNDLIVLANRISNYVYNIPSQFLHNPVSFDAYYAIMWGNSCTGHAHAAAALFRANGIPCRVLLNLPTMADNFYDQHWSVEYYIPDYGWVKMETSGGINPYQNAHDEIITFACNPEDEFSLIFPENIEAYWFSSDPVFTHSYPYWGEAHSAIPIKYINDSTSKIDNIICLTDSIYKYNTLLQGTKLINEQGNYFSSALSFQSKALVQAKAGKTDSIIYFLKQALNEYKRIDIKPIKTIFYDNFENDINGWLHGGTKDNWELGIPLVGPSQAYSEHNCWGTDLDSLYANNVNCWLLSPQINLNNLSFAYLSFWIWNDVEDSYEGANPYDGLFVELSTDNGNTFSPISTYFGGVNDDDSIPKVSGWSHFVLDISQYVDSTVRIRFHFTSDNSVTYAGSYIDDVHVYGRETGSSGIKEEKYVNSLNLKCYPNPFTNNLDIHYNLPYPDYTNIEILNILGQIVFSKTSVKQETGEQILNINTQTFIQGTYFIKINTCKQQVVYKCVKL